MVSSTLLTALVESRHQNSVDFGCKKGKETGGVEAGAVEERMDYDDPDFDTKDQQEQSDHQSEHIAEIVGRVIAAAHKNPHLSPCTRSLSSTQQPDHLKHQFLEFMQKKGNNLYPSRQEKQEIAIQLGASLDQVTRLLANHRRRQLKSKKYTNNPVSKPMPIYSQQHSIVHNDKENEVLDKRSPLSMAPEQCIVMGNTFNLCKSTNKKEVGLDNSEKTESSSAEEKRERRIDETIDSIIWSRVFGNGSANRESEAAAAILQLQSDSRTHKDGWTPPFNFARPIKSSSSSPSTLYSSFSSTS